MSNSTDACCAFEAPMVDRLLPPLLFLEFIFGLTGNVLALCMFAFHVESWKPSSIYLAHLAVADCVILVCMPIRADYYLRAKDWIHGDLSCRILLFFFAFNRAAGIFFLTAVAVDRYLRIVHPMHRLNRMGLRYANMVCVGLWVMTLCMTSYLLGSTHLFWVNNRTQCESFNICMGNSAQATWQSAFYVIQFCIPSIIIIFCTVRITKQLKDKTTDTQGKIRRAVQFIFVVALVFILCFFPSTAARVSVWILKNWYSECRHFSDVNLAFYLTLSFTYLNSALNPLVYYFSTPAFSGTLNKLFLKFKGKKVEIKNMDINDEL